MPFKKLLIANRGEIAIRIARAAGEAGLATVAIYPADDALSLHVRAADAAHEIPGQGARAYLDIEAVIAAARATGCDALHPGYGFLSENTALARRCAEDGIVFVGPSPEALELFGDKAKAKALAKSCGVPIIDGTSGATTCEEAKAFFASLGAGGAVMIKAIAGGGGRGMRIVDDGARLEEAYARCQSEAKAAFGSGERLCRTADPESPPYRGADHRRPAWRDQPSLGARMHGAAAQPEAHRGRAEPVAERGLARAASSRPRKKLAAAARYDNLGTFEFLVDDEAKGSDAAFAFIEANPRLQVEHTVTEEVLGVDVVQIAARGRRGRDAGQLGLSQAEIPLPRGYAMQLRVNMEVMDEKGGTTPTGGTLSAFDLPSGPGVRVDTFGYTGYTTSAAYDFLLAKVIVHAPGAQWNDVVQKAARALREFRIGGVATNIPFLQRCWRIRISSANRISTRLHRRRTSPRLSAAAKRTGRYASTLKRTGRPPMLAARPSRTRRALASLLPGSVAIPAPLQGTIVGDRRRRRRPGPPRPADRGARSHEDGASRHRAAWRQGDDRSPAAPATTLMQGEAILFIEPAEVEGDDVAEEADIDLDHIRPDLAEVIARHAITLDENRPARSRGGARPISARRARTSPTSSIAGSLRRIRLAGDRRAAPPPQGRRSDPEHAGRRPDHRHRHRQRGPVRRRRPPAAW